jgi:hypothetical protein
MRLTLKVVNAEFVRRGHTAQLFKSDGYFYFESREAADWLDRTVNLPTLSSLSLAQWIAEFERLKKLNAEIMKGGKTPAGKRKPPKRSGTSPQ